MSSEALIRAFNRAINFLGGGWIAVILGLIIVAFVIWFIFRSGRQLRLRIPFLPAGVGTINIGSNMVRKCKLAAIVGQFRCKLFIY